MAAVGLGPVVVGRIAGVPEVVNIAGHDGCRVVTRRRAPVDLKHGAVAVRGRERAYRAVSDPLRPWRPRVPEQVGVTVPVLSQGLAVRVRPGRGACRRG